MTTLGPRLVVAGTASGVGKTAVATGLMAALGRQLRVASAKVGPDFIDPGYHALATGGTPRNLDPWMCGPDVIPALAGRAAADADVLIVEGVMGLFDGADDGSPSSTADVAALLDAPVLLVVDAASTSASVAAVVRGFRDHDPRITLAGVVCNRVGSPRHEALLRSALAPLGVPVVGCVPRDDAFVWRDRHLGLVPVVEQTAAVIDSLGHLADGIAAHVDLDLVEAITRSAPSMSVDAPPLPSAVASCRIALATGAAFSFSYADNVDALVAAGAQIVTFDPRRDERLPDGVDGLVAGGGFPEVFAAELAANESLRADVRRRVADGLVTWAECGGMLWLAEALDGHAMVGAIPTTATLGDRRHLGYRTATTRVHSPVGPAGTTLRGHEFHYSTCEPGGDALDVTSSHHRGTDGFATPTMLATYVHHHAGGDPSLVEAFVRTATGHDVPDTGCP